jgi:hypothetical protein
MHKLAVSVLLSVAAFAQSRVSQQGVHRMEVTLERLESGAWKAIDPGLVVGNNDRVRFRFKANFSGFLYVTNRSTSNTTTLLFPRQDTGPNNRILPNREYIVPASKGAFRVDGPEGYDVVAWMVSPVELGRPESPAAPEAPPADLKPRCDDTIWKARGTCVDAAAGPQPKSRGNSDGLVFMRQRESSVISSPAPLKAPIVYEFHLAHK